MAVIESKQHIYAPVADIHRVALDLARHAAWDPLAAEIHPCSPDVVPSAGQSCDVLLRNGWRFRFEFVQITEKSTAIKLTAGPAFFSRLAASWLFEPRAGYAFARCKLVFSLKFWALPWLVEPLAGWWLKKRLDAQMTALKQVCETGRAAPVGIFNPPGCGGH